MERVARLRWKTLRTQGDDAECLLPAVGRVATLSPRFIQNNSRGTCHVDGIDAS
jgi:hypothetical protein